MSLPVIVLDPRDSVAVALVDLSAGQRCEVRVGPAVREVELREDIPFGHKFALHPIARGVGVLKYGEVIGHSTAEIEQGAWVHLHNLASSRGHDQLQGGGAL
ncbi:MAG TPA: UxaA family hydrolase [Chloroflexota bacterium]